MGRALLHHPCSCVLPNVSPAPNLPAPTHGTPSGPIKVGANTYAIQAQPEYEAAFGLQQAAGSDADGEVQVGLASGRERRMGDKCWAEAGVPPSPTFDSQRLKGHTLRPLLPARLGACGQQAAAQAWPVGARHGGARTRWRPLCT